jgi:urease subunit gamma/beta
MSYLNPTEEDRLRVFLVAELARRTRERGLRLNAPEATALIADEMHFAARAGKSYEEVVAAGMTALGPEDVIPGVAELVSQIRVEVLLEEGTRLIVLRQPIGGATPLHPAPGTVGERA